MKRITYGILGQLIARMTPEQRKQDVTVEILDCESGSECFAAELRLAGENHDSLDDGHPVLFVDRSATCEAADLSQALENAGLPLDGPTHFLATDKQAERFGTLIQAVKRSDVLLAPCRRTLDGAIVSAVLVLDITDHTPDPIWVPMALIPDAIEAADYKVTLGRPPADPATDPGA